jgi:sulfhydrogenase subunit alpha
MPANRRFEVQAMSRVEGEGALYVKMDGQRVEQVQLNIYEPPRFFESFLRGREVREVPDITARICGICPVAYQMSACHALEKALKMTIPEELRRLRRLLYCGEWLESHVLHIFMLHAPDFLGYDSSISMAADHRELVQQALRMKKAGNEILEVLGGRAIHPINVTVGGFYKAPRRDALRKLLPELQWGLQTAEASLEILSGLDFPQLDQKYEYVSLKHPGEYPMNEGQIVSSEGLQIEVEQYEEFFSERHVAHSNALHSVRLPGETPYLVGPLSRYNLCFEQLSPAARRAAERHRLPWPCHNNFQSILARMVEVIDAFEEAIAIIEDYQVEPTKPRIEYQLRAGEGCHATEAPRGLIYHRYRIGDDGLIAEAKIIPPTSQNQAQIEDDLRKFVPTILDFTDPEVTRKCEHLVRNYDPCISCATHFLTVTLDRPKLSL